MLKLGPKFMKGTVWDECGNTEIVQILISYEQLAINSIQFVYAGRGGAGYSHSQVHGDHNGSKFNIVTLDYPSEFLISVSGEYRNDRLVSISFGTNKRKNGPFGRREHCNETFDYEFAPKSCFGGFYGTIFDSRVHAIGIHINPIGSTPSRPLPSTKDEENKGVMKKSMKLLFQSFGY